MYNLSIRPSKAVLLPSDCFRGHDNGSLHWYDLDVPEVIELRCKFIPETERSRCIPKSVFDLSWFDDIDRPVHGLLFIACGVFQYFTGKHIKQLFSDLATRFPGSEIIFDTLIDKKQSTIKEAKMSNDRRSLSNGEGSLFI